MLIEKINLVLNDKVAYGTLEIKDNLITKITILGPENKDANYLVPGFIDEHIHGSNNYDAMDQDSRAIIEIKNNLVKYGVTSFFPTTMSEPLNNIEKAINNIRLAKNDPSGARIIGVNVEGPFLAREYCGAQDPKNIIDIDFNFLNKVNYDKIIKIMTVSPNIKNYDKLVDLARKDHFELSIGHTNANYSEASHALDLGVKLFTHAYNAMQKFHHRDIGTVGAMLLDNNSYAELILDLIHVSVPAAQLLIKNKGLDKIILITDAMRAQGLANGITSHLGGQKVFINNNEARLKDGTLAGSIISYDQLFRNAHFKLGLSLPDCVKITATNQARLHKLEQFGEIKTGYLADLVILDQDLKVLKTIKEGSVVYEI